MLSTAPKWTDAGHSVGMVGVPVNAIMDWPMATRAGFAAFQDPKVNQVVSKAFSELHYERLDLARVETDLLV